MDLGARYPATLDWTERAIEREWTVGPEDVWRVSEFEIALGDAFRVTAGAADVVFGRHGTNVVWAAVLPDAPGRIIDAPAGAGDRVASLWLRFNPARVAELFPPGTVVGQGDPASLVWARRLDALKMNAAWQSGNWPVIPWRRSIVVDMETAEGPRRMFMLDTDAGEARYEPFFETRPLAPLVDVASGDGERIFDDVWGAFDAEYAMFKIKPWIDWDALRAEYRPRALAAATTYELGATVAEMLGRLRDLHVAVRVGGEYAPGYRARRSLNANYRAAGLAVGGLREPGPQLAWGRTADGIGYVNVSGLGNPALPDLFDAALEALGDTWALVVDLRFNGGGDELLARKIAGRFAAQRRVYSLNQYREGPGREDLGPRLERAFEPRGPWRYRSPVIALWGARTMSSAESFALMLDQCPQITTMGAPTAGASANPRTIEAPGQITVTLPRWLDMDAQGKPFENAGLAPDVVLDVEERFFTETEDPALGFALSRLRERPVAERRPGKRN